MENIRFRVITPKNGEIREFNRNNKKEFKKTMEFIREQCKYWDGFVIDYKINDIIDTVICQNKTYFGKDCVVERVGI